MSLTVHRNRELIPTSSFGKGRFGLGRGLAPARFFLPPQNSTHRQYEALRAHFVEGLPSSEAARRGGYTPGSFRVLVHPFRQDPHRQFFLPAAKGPKTAPKTERLREKVIALRKQNLSI
jgi:hypothetical protein